MRNLRQSRLLKAVAVVLLFFSILSVPVSLVGEFYLADKVFDGNKREMFKGEFKDSHLFFNLFSKRIGQLAEYIKLKNILETDGVLDYNRVVCSIAEDSTEYTIGDLIKRNSFFVEDIGSQSDKLLEELFSSEYQYAQVYLHEGEDGEPILGFYYSGDFIRNLEKEDWIAVKKQEDALELFYGIEKYGMENSLIEENATDVIVATIRNKEQPEGSVWVYTLDDLSYRYTYYVAYYLYYHSLFSTGAGSSFIYELSNGVNRYTNIEDIEAYRNGELRMYGALRYKSSEYTIETDVSNVRRDYVDNLEKALMVPNKEVNICVGVKNQKAQIAKDDIFFVTQVYFSQAQDLSKMLLIFGFAGVLGFVIMGFYLLASAGHAKDIEGVRLTRFDKWYTEIAAILCITVCISAVLITGSLINELCIIVPEYGFSDSEIASLVGIVFAVIFTYLSILFSIATLVRRVKAGTLWSNSFLRNGTIGLVHLLKKLMEICRVIYEERDSTTRITIAYLMVLAATVVTVILILISLWSGSVLALFFLLLFAGIHAGTLYMLLRERIDFRHIVEGVERMADGDLNYKIDEIGLQMDSRRLAVAANRVGDGLAEAVEKSIKDERMKTDLITNVSHDIKTPLTSIINYVALLKREEIDNEKIRSYIEVLDSKSQRLKNLTDDLVEASKLSSGNIVLAIQELNLVELVSQANGEFTEKFEQKNLTIVQTLPEVPVVIEADGRRIWRVLENLYNNVSKYAMDNTRVYVAVVPESDRASFIIKNISANPLNISAEELTERFIRGDVSRSTEGSGLGLSIAQSLTELMKGSFEIYLDGDLFRVTVSFPMVAGAEKSLGLLGNL